MDSWIRLGLVWKADSMFNTPLFCLQHLSGYCIIQDFRALNMKDHQGPIKFKKVHETLMNLEQAAQTAFTILGQGQLQWNHTPLGVLGAQASFHQLFSAPLRDINGVLVHIDRVVLYHHQQDNHLVTLNKVLKTLYDNGLRLNIHQSQVGMDSANVMGFQISRCHIHMAAGQLGTAEQWEPPADAKMILTLQLL